MILVFGSVVIKKDSIDQARELSLEHVRRSREEPGCISHSVQVDCENPLRLVFVEEWADHASLAAHFKVPESQTFAEALTAIASSPPNLTVFEAERTAV